MRGVERVSGSGVVDVIAMLIRQRSIVREIVDPLESERRPHLVALGRVIVDHVEDHLDAGVVEGADHIAQPLLSTRPQIAVRRGEEAQRIVSPIVPQALGEQVVVVREPVDREKFDRRDPERLHIADNLLVAEALEGAAQGLGNGRVKLREAAHVRFVDDRARPWDGAAKRRRSSPFRARIDDDTFRHRGGAVGFVKRQVRRLLPEDITVGRLAPRDVAFDRPRIGVDQELVGVESMSRFRLERPVNTVAISGSSADPRQKAVPDLVGVFGQRDTLDLRPVRREQTEFDALGVRGKQGEIGPVLVDGSPQSRRIPRLDGPRGFPFEHMLASPPMAGAPADRREAEALGRSSDVYNALATDWFRLSWRRPSASTPPSRGRLRAEHPLWPPPQYPSSGRRLHDRIPVCLHGPAGRAQS